MKTLSIIFAAIVLIPCSGLSQKDFVTSDTVITTAVVNVRAEPAAAILGTQPAETTGTVLLGPAVATLNGREIYWWEVHFETGASGWVGEDNLSLLSEFPPEVPSVPGNRLTWTDRTFNEEGFRIERSIDGGEFVGIATTPANVTTYADEGLQFGTDYRYRVAAWNVKGQTDWSNIAGRTPLPPLYPPDGGPPELEVETIVDHIFTRNPDGTWSVEEIIQQDESPEGNE